MVSMTLTRKGVVGVRAEVSASNGLQRVTRVLEERHVLRLSTIVAGYKDKATGRLLKFDISKDAVFDRHYQPREIKPSEWNQSNQNASYMLDISPYALVRTVDRDAP